MAFPLVTHVDYMVPKDVKARLVSSRERVLLHPVHLGYESGCTTKPLPFFCTARALVEEYLLHGVATESEPLTIWAPKDWQDEEEVFWVHYVKGMARSCTLLALLHLLLEREVDVSALPKFTSSIACLHAIYEQHTDVGSVAISNANLSARGSIRQTHCLLTWVAKLSLLRDCLSEQMDPASVLDKFNEQATGRAKVTGPRRQSALNLMSPSCKEGVGVMLTLLSEVGPDQVFWLEDTWANRKLLPGFQSRMRHAKWSQILRVTEKSFLLMVTSLATQLCFKTALK